MDKSQLKKLLCCMPFYTLTNFQLLEEFQAPRTKFVDMLKENDFSTFLQKSVPKETLDVINCKYYSVDDFNTNFSSVNTLLSMIHVNLQSSYGNFGVLKAHLELLKQEFDIIAISEAGPGNQDRCAHIFGENYVYDYYSPSGRKGGVALYINKRLACKKRDDLEIKGNPQIDNLWYEISMNNRQYIVSVIYRHPGYCTSDICDALQINLAKINSEHKGSIMCGDMNINLLQPNNPQTKLYTDTVLAADTIPLITLPTRITCTSATLIDHINITGLDKFNTNDISTGNLFFEIADHLPNFILVKGKNSSKMIRPMMRIFSEKNKAKFKTEISLVNWENTLGDEDPNKSYNAFAGEFSKAFNKCFPLVRLSRSKAKDKKWITPGLKISIKHKNRLYRKFLKKPSERNQTSYKRYKNILKTLVKKCEKEYYSQLLQDNKKHAKNIWNIYGEIMNKKKKTPKVTELNTNSKTLKTDKEVADGFNKFFSSIGHTMAKQCSDQSNCIDNISNHQKQNMFLTPVTEEELLKELHKIPSKKSSGLDGIPCSIMKEVGNFIARPLTHIFNCSFREAKVPTELKLAKIIPIFKKGDMKSPGNYRPISLLNSISKILEKLVHKRLYSYLQDFNILHDHQFGFRKRHSTLLALTEIIDNIRTQIDEGNYVIGIFLDLSKAFDSVNHKILLQKMNHYGIRGLVLDWFQDYLSNRKQVVCINSTLSEEIVCDIGVPQGSVLGPLLFLLYINDISDSINEGSLRLFADDTNLFITHKNLAQAKLLAESTLIKLNQWFNANKLTVNLEKTHFSVYSNRDSKQLKELDINGHIIKRTAVVKYLGLYLDERLSWNSHIDHISQKLTKLTYVFRTLSKFIDKDMVHQLYYGFIYPHITYGIELFGSACQKYIKQLQVVQNKLLKILSNKRFRYSSTELHRELNLLTVKNIHYLQTNVFVYKQRNGLLPQIFNNYYRLNKDINKRNTRQDNNLYIQRARSCVGEVKVSILGARYWNSLPNGMKVSNSLPCFKKELKKHLYQMQ